VKLHTLLDLRGNIPTVCFLTPGRVHDVNLLDQVVIEAGAIYLFDRAYLDFARLYRLHQALGFFVTRAKRNFRFRYLDSRPVDRTVYNEGNSWESEGGFPAFPWRRQDAGHRGLWCAYGYTNSMGISTFPSRV
jgi:hypothetical protein